MSQSKRPVGTTWSRRDFLKLNAGAVGALALHAPWLRAEPDQLLREIEVLRPHDLLVARFRFVNCVAERHASGRGFRLQRFSRSVPAYVLLDLPAQHLVEDGTAPEKEPTNAPREFVAPVELSGPIHLRMSGPSVLAWQLQEDDFREDIPFRLNALLRKVATLPLHVRPVREQAPPWETRIEWPYRLWLAPWPDQRFFHLGQAHAVARAVAGRNWIWQELWHTGLDLRPWKEWNSSTAPVLSLSKPPRADANSRAELLEGPVTPDVDARGVLQTLEVRNDFPIPEPQNGDPLEPCFPPALDHLTRLHGQLSLANGVLRARQLLLTSLGASGDVEYRAQVNDPGGLRIWNQRTAIGRDNYIRVVTNGYLMPYQHQAVFVQIWERKLARVRARGSADAIEDLPTAAMILRRQFIVVLEPEKLFTVDDSTGHSAADRLARQQQFSWVKIKNERTPNLVRDKDGRMSRSPYVFWPVAISEGPNGKPFEFQLEGRDRAGNHVSFTQRLLYVEDLEEGGAYYDGSQEEHRTAHLPQQRMAFAQETGAPVTAAELNPQTLGWITKLVEDAKSDTDAARLLGGAERASAALAGLRGAVELGGASGAMPMDQQTVIGAHLEELFGANDLSPSKLRRALVGGFWSWLPSEDELRAWLQNSTPVSPAAVALKKFVKVLEDWKANVPALLQPGLKKITEQCGVISEALRDAPGRLEKEVNAGWERVKNLPLVPPETDWKMQQFDRAARSLRQTLESVVTQIIDLAQSVAQAALDDLELVRANIDAQAGRAEAAIEQFATVVDANVSAVDGKITEGAKALAADWARRRTGFLQSINSHLENIENRKDALLDTLEDLSAVVPAVRDLQTELQLNPQKLPDVVQKLRDQRTHWTAEVGRAGAAARLKQTLIISAMKDRITGDWIGRVQKAEKVLFGTLGEFENSVRDAFEEFDRDWKGAIEILKGAVNGETEEEVRRHLGQFLEPLRAWRPVSALLQKNIGSFAEMESELKGLRLPAQPAVWIPLLQDFLEAWDSNRPVLRIYFPALEAREFHGAWVALFTRWEKRIADGASDEVTGQLNGLREALKHNDVFWSLLDGNEEIATLINKLKVRILPLFQSPGNPAIAEFFRRWPAAEPDSGRPEQELTPEQKDRRKRRNQLPDIWQGIENREPFLTLAGVWQDAQQVVTNLVDVWSRLTAAIEAEDRKLVESCQTLWGTMAQAPRAIAVWMGQSEPTAVQHREGVEALRTLIVDILRRTSADWEKQQRVLLKILARDRNVLLRLMGARLPVRPPDPALLAREIRFKINDTVRKLGADGLNAAERHLPRMEEALAEVPALKRISPAQALARIKPFEDFVDHGFARLQHGVLEGVRNGVYAEFVAPLKGVGKELEAGVMRPVMQFAGLSREAGALAGQGVESLREMARPAKAEVAEVLKAAKEIKEQIRGGLERKLNDLLGGPAAGRIRRDIDAIIDEIDRVKDKLQPARDRTQKARDEFEAAAASAVAGATATARKKFEEARGEMERLERIVRAEQEKFDRTRREIETKLARYRAAGEQLLAEQIAQLGDTIEAIQQLVEQVQIGLKELLSSTLVQQTLALKNLVESRLREAEAFFSELKQHIQARIDQRIAEAHRRIRAIETELREAVGAHRDELLAELQAVRGRLAPLEEKVAELRARVKVFRDKVAELTHVNLAQVRAELERQLKKEAEEHLRRAKGEAERWLKDKAEELTGKLDLEKWLPDIKLLGSLELQKLLAQVDDFSRLPQIISREFPERAEVAWNWETFLRPKDFGLIKFEPKGSRQFRLASLVRTELPRPGRKDVPPPQASVNGEVDSFEVLLANCIRIRLDRLTFQSGTGQATRVTPHGLKVGFEGPLAFVARLEEFLRKLTGAKGLVIRLQNNFIEVGLSLPLQPLTFGAFSLTNIRLTTWLGVPLADGVMRYRFSFCERDAPFLLTVSTFAGGGFLTLGVDSDGGRLIEGALEFGGAIALNLGVAKGSVQVMGGFYFRSTREAATASGYLRIAGHLTILGWIEVSVEIVLGLTYQREGGQSVFAGYAMLRVSVKIGFFKKSFSFRVYRRFAGAGGGSSRKEQENAFVPPARHGALAYAGAPSGRVVSGTVCEADDLRLPGGGSGSRSFRRDPINWRDWQRYRVAFAD